MPISGITKATIISRAFVIYNETEGKAGEFTSTAVGTFVQQAAQEFTLRSGCLVGSSRITRPDTATGESWVTIPTGGFRVFRVDWLRRIGATQSKSELRQTTMRQLSLREGPSWMYDSESTCGTAADNHAYYRVGARKLGFYPPNVTSTAGTVIVHYHRVATAMATGTSVCDIPAEFIPGVEYLTAKRMAEKDSNSSVAATRAQQFEARAAEYIGMASAYRPLEETG